MHGARFRDEKLCSCAGWRFNCSGAVITAITVLIRSEVVGVAKVANDKNDLVKGSLTRQKLHNSKVYAKSPEFSPALGLIIFGKKSVATTLR